MSDDSLRERRICGGVPMSDHTETIKLTPQHLFNMVEAERVEWCTTHKASFFGLDRCGFYLFNDPIYEGDPDPGDCVVGSALVVSDGGSET